MDSSRRSALFITATLVYAIAQGSISWVIHLAGDDCLKKISQKIDRCANRTGDLTARYGGEEIVVILPNTDEQSAFYVAEQIRVEILALAIPHKAITVENHSIVSVSMGTASQGSHAHDYRTNLLQLADKALYKAKAAGRNQSVIG